MVLLLWLAVSASPNALAQAAPGAKPAAASEPISAQEKRRLLAEAKELRQRATQLGKDADARQAETSAACYEKFLVNDCLEDAKEARLKVTQETRRLQLQAGDIERDVKRRERVTAEQQRIDSEPERREQAQRDQAQRKAEELEQSDRRAAHARQREETKAAATREREARQRRDAAKAEDRAKAEAKARERAEATRKQQAEIDRKIAERERNKAEKAAEARKAGKAPAPALAK